MDNYHYNRRVILCNLKTKNHSMKKMVTNAAWKAPMVALFFYIDNSQCNNS